jgi:ABC-type branched-subunit amino acid transport system ATPase component
MLDTAKADDTLLEVNNIEVIYNHVILVLKGVSLKVPKGGITALLGGNGAGKSTTLKAISGLLASERGEITKGSSCNYFSVLIQGLYVFITLPKHVVKSIVYSVFVIKTVFTEIVLAVKAIMPHY